MSENTKIEWADHTFNPWEGCQKVGPGCDHCYAETRNARFGGGQAVNWGPGAPRRRTSDSNWSKPRRWNAAHAEFFAQHGRRQRVFCASLADVFDNAAEDEWRADLFTLISETPHLDWLLLTKRVGNVARMLPVWWEDPAAWPGSTRPHANVWLGATVTDQAEATRDIARLLKAPAERHFISYEPALGPISELTIAVHGGGFLDWVICGGESGPHARPMHPDWARGMRDRCEAAGVPFLFKQWGEWAPGSGDFGRGGFVTAAIDRAGRVAVGGVSAGDYPAGATAADGWAMVHKAGKKAAGRQLDGRTHDAFPATGQQS